MLDRRGIVVVPDILANAGGVTASYFEWAQAQQGYPWDDQVVAERLRSRMETAFTEVWARAETLGVNVRTAAHVVAVERVRRRHHGPRPLPVALPHPENDFPARSVAPDDQSRGEILPGW